MKYWKIFSKGIITENPILRLALSLCPALAVTSEAKTALVMGLSVLFVITTNNVVVSIFRKLVNAKVRVPVYIMSIATIVTVVELILKAFLPELADDMKLYLSLIVVFAIILARAEVFASKNSIFPSFLDGFGMGIGFTLAMLLIGCLREVFGCGTIFGVPVADMAFNSFGYMYDPPLIVVLAPGGFIVIGIIIGIMNLLGSYQKAKNEKVIANKGVTA